MFIVSKRNYMVRRADDSAYLIPKKILSGRSHRTWQRVIWSREQ